MAELPSGECEDDEQHQDGYQEGDQAQLAAQPHLFEHVVHLFLRRCQPVVGSLHLFVQVVQHSALRLQLPVDLSPQAA